MKITIKKFYEAKRVNKELTELKAQFQHPVPENKSIADLNHIVINACMNIYARITDRVVISEVDKIIEQVKSFTSLHPVPDEAPKEWEEQATRDYENGYESETSAIDKFMVADEAGEVYVWVKASERLPTDKDGKESSGKVFIRNTHTNLGMMWPIWEIEEMCDLPNIEWLSPAPPSGEDAVRFAEWILSEAILPRDTNWFDAGKHYTSQELYQQYLTAPKP